MNLKDIGFYTLSDARVANVAAQGVFSPLSRCELILTNACNFKCPYCRGLPTPIRKTMPIEKAKFIVKMWGSHKLKNVRFSGGEPTVYPHIVELVKYAKEQGIERIAISSNGSAELDFYDQLVEAGVNDFSISLDACCASFGDKMAGDVQGAWEKVVRSIKHLSKKVYVTVGIVVTEDTIKELPDTIRFAESLGVSDIRIISAAQYNTLLSNATALPQDIVDRFPILKYRINNILNGRNVRGIREEDSHMCGLVLDDMAIAGDFHFPCIIHMREAGAPIGKINFNNDPFEEMKRIREERREWMLKTDTSCEGRCSKNCLDVCISYNKYMALTCPEFKDPGY